MTGTEALHRLVELVNQFGDWDLVMSNGDDRTVDDIEFDEDKLIFVIGGHSRGEEEDHDDRVDE